MKLVSKNKSEWKRIDRIILNVNAANISFDDSVSINVDCSFENIAKGRCNLIIKEKKRNRNNNLFVHTDKALMVVNVFYNANAIEKLINFFSIKVNSSKKVKVVLEISESLMINTNGYLYVKDNLEIKIDSTVWNIPII
tara:strand:+ start:165 stop:581 length:417 start_codon:yes stop_codon:yes gene_type:complete